MHNTLWRHFHDNSINKLGVIIELRNMFVAKVDCFRNSYWNALGAHSVGPENPDYSDFPQNAGRTYYFKYGECFTIFILLIFVHPVSEWVWMALKGSSWILLKWPSLSIYLIINTTNRIGIRIWPCKARYLFSLTLISVDNTIRPTAVGLILLSNQYTGLVLGMLF